MATHATDKAWSQMNTTEEIIAAVRAGEMVVILDDEERENEGDLVMAASCVRAEDINFMARYGRGLICLTLTRARCEQLRLPLMVSNTDVRQTTNFTVSIEAAEGVTTGISAHDRARSFRGDHEGLVGWSLDEHFVADLEHGGVTEPQSMRSAERADHFGRGQPMMTGDRYAEAIPSFGIVEARDRAELRLRKRGNAARREVVSDAPVVTHRPREVSRAPEHERRSVERLATRSSAVSASDPSMATDPVSMLAQIFSVTRNSAMPTLAIAAFLVSSPRSAPWARSRW